MIAVFRWSAGRTERLLQESHTHTRGAAHFSEGSRRPRFALHHFREQGQPDANDLAFLGQTRHSLLEKLLVLLGCLGAVFWKLAEGTSKSRQHLSGVVQVKEIEHSGVLAFDQPNFQLA